MTHFFESLQGKLVLHFLLQFYRWQRLLATGHNTPLCFLHHMPFSFHYIFMVSIYMEYLGHLFICITSISESIFSNIESFHSKMSIWFIFIFSISLVIVSTCVDIIFMVSFSYWSMVPFSSLSLIQDQ